MVRLWCGARNPRDMLVAVWDDEPLQTRQEGNALVWQESKTNPQSRNKRGCDGKLMEKREQFRAKSARG